MPVERKAGEIFEVPYPFFREDDGDPSWRPGAQWEDSDGRPAYATANGLGVQILNVVGFYKPGKYPPRVFFTRKWRDPDGKEFGKNGCRITSASHFTALLKGYRHEFTLEPAAPCAGGGN